MTHARAAGTPTGGSLFFRPPHLPAISRAVPVIRSSLSFRAQRGTCFLPPYLPRKLSPRAAPSPLQHILVRIQLHLLRRLIHIENHRPRGIPRQRHLSQPDHAFPEVREHWHEHREIFV